MFGELERAEARDGAQAAAARTLLDALAVEVGAAQRPERRDDDALLHRPTVATYNSFADQIVREHARAHRAGRRGRVLSESAAWLLDAPRRVRLRRPAARDARRGGPQHRRRRAADRAATASTTSCRSTSSPRSRVGSATCSSGRRPARATVVYARRRDGRGEGRRAGPARRSRARVRSEKRADRRARLLRPGRRRPARSSAATRRSPTSCATASASCCSTSTRTPRSCRPTCWRRSSTTRPSWRSATRISRSTAGAGRAPATSAASRGVLARTARARSSAPDQLAQQRAGARRRERRARAAGGIGVRRRWSALRAAPRRARAARSDSASTPTSTPRPIASRSGSRSRHAPSASRRDAAGPTTGRDPVPQQEAHGALRRRARPARHPAPHPRTRRPAVHARGGRRRVARCGCPATRARGRRSSGCSPARDGRSGCPTCASSPPSPRRIARHDAALQPLAPEVVERIRGSRRRRRAARSSTRSTSSCATARPRLARRLHARGARAAARGGVRLRRAAAGGRACRSPSSCGSSSSSCGSTSSSRPTRRAGPRASRRRSCARSSTSCTPSSPPTSPGRSSSLLAWLDHAEQLDEFAPRTEPPEDDVVQLLTIHGSKGLEWDAVAVVRLVEGRAAERAARHEGLARVRRPSLRVPRRRALAARAARGSADVAPTQQDLKAAIEAFVAANRARQLEEDRRLAYVAVTRARDHLLLTGSSWSGTQRAAASAARSSHEIADALGAELLRRDDPGENPYLGERRVLQWPHRSARRASRGGASAPPRRSSRRLARAAPEPDADAARCSSPSATSAAARRRIAAPDAHRGLPLQGVRRRLRRHGARDRPPAARAAVPPDPARHAVPRVGRAALGHASGTGGSLDDALWELDDDAPEHRGVGRGRGRRSRSCAANFVRRSGRRCSPIEVETEIDFTAESALDGRPHIVICKLDAVYRRDDRGGRIEIVDWKTGAAAARGGRAGGADAAARAVPPGLPREARRPARRDRRRALLRRATTWCCAADRRRRASGTRLRQRRSAASEARSASRLRRRSARRAASRRASSLARSSARDVDRRGRTSSSTASPARGGRPRRGAPSAIRPRRGIALVRRRPTATALRDRRRRSASRCRRPAADGSRHAVQQRDRVVDAERGIRHDLVAAHARRERLEQADGVVDRCRRGRSRARARATSRTRARRTGGRARAHEASGARPLCATYARVDVVGGGRRRREPLQVGRGVADRQPVPLEQARHLRDAVDVLEEEGCRARAAEHDGGLEAPQLVGLDGAAPAVEECARAPRRVASARSMSRADVVADLLRACGPEAPRSARSRAEGRGARRAPRRPRSRRRDPAAGGRRRRGSRAGSRRPRRGRRRARPRRAARARGRGAARARRGSARAARAPRRRARARHPSSAGTRTTTRRPSSSSATAAS